MSIRLTAWAVRSHLDLLPPLARGPLHQARVVVGGPVAAAQGGQDCRAFLLAHADGLIGGAVHAAGGSKRAEVEVAWS